MQITGCPRRWIFAGFAVGTLLIAGCGEGPSRSADAKQSATGAAPGERKASGSGKLESASKSASTVELKAVKYDELAAAIEAQRGHVVVMDVWAEY
jgi:hypothetical protein